MFDRRMTRLALAFCALALVSLSLPAKAEARDGIEFCLAKDYQWRAVEHLALAEEYGLDDCSTIFWHVHHPQNIRDPLGWVIVEYFNKGHNQIIMPMILNGGHLSTVGKSEVSESGTTSTAGNLEMIISGYYDQALIDLAAKTRRVGKPILLVPMYEGDGNWFPWAMFTDGNSPELFVKAYIHVVEIFRQHEAPVTFGLSLNRRDAKGQPVGTIDMWFDELIPYIDEFFLSSYCRSGTNPSSYQEPRSFAEEFGPAYDILAARTDKPINVGETATTEKCGNRFEWYEQMLVSLETRFPQVKRVTFFFGTVPIGAASNPDEPIVWGFQTPEERQVFRHMLNDFRARLDESDRTEAAPAENGQPSLKHLRWRAEGSLFADLSQTFVGVENEARNPVTGNEFGRVGTFFTSRLTQTFRAEVADGVEIGPRFFTGLDFSDEPNMWWTHRFQNGVALDACFDAAFALWGDMCAFVEGRHILYLADAPDRFSQGFGGREGEVQARAGIRVNFGWNLLD